MFVLREFVATGNAYQGVLFYFVLLSMLADFTSPIIRIGIRAEHRSLDAADCLRLVDGHREPIKEEGMAFLLVMSESHGPNQHHFYLVIGFRRDAASSLVKTGVSLAFRTSATKQSAQPLAAPSRTETLNATPS